MTNTFTTKYSLGQQVSILVADFNDRHQNLGAKFVPGIIERIEVGGEETEYRVGYLLTSGGGWKWVEESQVVIP